MPGAGPLIQITGRWDGAGPPPGQKQGTFRTVSQIAAQQVGGRRRPHHHICAATLRADTGPPSRPVQVPHIEGQHFRRSSGCFVQHPPQRLLPQRHRPPAHRSLRSPTGSARVLSTDRRRGSTPASGSPARGHRSPHQEAKARTAVRRVFHVAAARPAHNSSKTAATRPG